MTVCAHLRKYIVSGLTCANMNNEYKKCKFLAFECFKQLRHKPIQLKAMFLQKTSFENFQGYHEIKEKAIVRLG